MCMTETIETPIAPELAEKIQELVNVAFEKSPKVAIDQARNTGNAALVDALHGALSEPAVHDQLVQRGKILPAQ